MVTFQTILRKHFKIYSRQDLFASKLQANLKLISGWRQVFIKQ